MLAETQTTRFVDVGPARVCCRTVGEGPALVLLHGYPVTGLTWRKMLPTLSRRFTCHAFDLVGFGGSWSTAPVDYSSQGEARVLQRALRTMGIERYSLLGNDSGGWIARELALIDGERVTSMVLTNTEIPNHRPPWVWVYQWMAKLPGGSWLFRALLEARWWRRSPAGFGGCFQDRDLIDGEWGKLFLKPICESPERVRLALRFLTHMKFYRVDQFRQLHRMLTMPVGFVWGSADPTFPEKHAREMAAQFPNVVQFTSVPQGKLFMHEEMPDAVLGPTLEILEAARALRA